MRCLPPCRPTGRTALKSHLIALACACSSVVLLTVAQASADELIDAAYAKPGQMTALADGRSLNLRCSGEGEPVIVLEAGGNAESSTWYRVQPLLAQLSRVCSYDRAGYGFSDEGPMPRDLHADVADLHALIQAAELGSPVLLVGHSLGSNIVRSYAQQHPGDIAGMVLVDPPEQGADQNMPQDWQSQIESMVARREQILEACEHAATTDDDETLQQQCLRKAPGWAGPEVAAAMARNKSRPTYWRTLRSELASNIQLFSAPVAADESYGSIPLVLLRAAQQDGDVPEAVAKVSEAARSQTHARILAGSPHSVVIDVADSSHDIQLDQPQAVVAAVRQVLEAPAQADEPEPR